MRVFLSLVIGCCLGTSWVSAEGEVPECPALSEELRTQLSALTVTEDVHDKLVGTYYELWGQKSLDPEDEDICLKYTRTKVDATNLIQSPLNATGNNAKGLSMEKVANGIYILKEDDGTASAKYYFTYVGEHVQGYFVCALISVPASTNVNFPLGIAGVAVHADDVKTPLEAGVQAEVDAALKIIQDHKDFSPIVNHSALC